MRPLLQNGKHNGEAVGKRHVTEHRSMPFVEVRWPLWVREVTKVALLAIDATTTRKVEARSRAQLRVADTARVELRLAKVSVFGQDGSLHVADGLLHRSHVAGNLARHPFRRVATELLPKPLDLCGLRSNEAAETLLGGLHAPPLCGRAAAATATAAHDIGRWRRHRRRCRNRQRRERRWRRNCGGCPQGGRKGPRGGRGGTAVHHHVQRRRWRRNTGGRRNQHGTSGPHSRRQRRGC
mmetsp:Transcript_61744/g.155904  ORF Transcript_61744/g.155904 Transcript_61744/m.155904 type:complete len:238 (-) Transcript_61744:142-855(-)